MTVEAIDPHGFCSGVAQALRRAEEALAHAPAFCLHPLVHNERIAADLSARGMRMVGSLADIPVGATVVFSAHGVSPAVRTEALRHGLCVVDATCPFVMRLHRQARLFAARGTPVVLIGHVGHAEVQGLSGEVEASGGTFQIVRSVTDVGKLPFPEDGPVGVLCQTTFDAEAAAEVLAALAARYPGLVATPASEACSAARDRQEAVRAFVRSGGDGVLVLGSATSSNTLRLMDVACEAGARLAARAAALDEIAGLDLGGISRLGVSAGASTPETFFEEAMSMLVGMAARMGQRA